MKPLLFLLTLISFFAHAQKTPVDVREPVVLDSTYDHTKYSTSPTDLVYNFAAFTTSFDSADDNNGNSTPDIWGIPEWVSYEIKKELVDHPSADRPSTWKTEDSLYKAGIAPSDKTYAVSGTRKLKEVTTDYRYVRGHMCSKATAQRISEAAEINTHHILNCVPQLQWQNNQIWGDLEDDCLDWADKYNSLWVICGPVFFDRTPAVWLGQEGEVKAAVPDALFKIVIRESDNGIETLSFIIPNVVPKAKEYPEYLTSIDRIENLTGLTFMTNLTTEQKTQISQLNEGLSKSKKKEVVGKW